MKLKTENMRGTGRPLAMLFTAFAAMLLVSCTTKEVLEPSSVEGTEQTAESTPPWPDVAPLDAANAELAQAQPSEPLPAPAQPIQPLPAPAQPGEMLPAPAQPIQPLPAPAQPSEAQPAPAQPTQTQAAPAEPDQAQPTQPDQAQPAPASAAATAGSVRFRFAPIVGSTVEAISPLAERMAQKARENGFRLARSDDMTATYVLKGYLSALSEGDQTTVIYVWDVLDTSGNRLHRIQGQQIETGKGEGWTAVQPQTMKSIGDVTVDQLKTWLAANNG